MDDHQVALRTAPANEVIEPPLAPFERMTMEEQVQHHIENLLVALRIEPDAHTAQTPQRVARMLVREACAGRFEPAPAMTSFPADGFDQIIAVGPITFRSMCAHHLLPIIGRAWIGVLPGDRLVGLSKYGRAVEWVAARPTMQERATQQIAQFLQDAIQPRGLAVVIQAQHFCQVWRGVRDENASMTTSYVSGVFRDDAAARSEVLASFRNMGA